MAAYVLYEPYASQWGKTKNKHSALSQQLYCTAAVCRGGEAEGEPEKSMTAALE